DVRELQTVSKRTESILRSMLVDQRDPVKMSRHFEQIEKNRAIVERKFEAFELLNFMNQLGVFRRMKADRRLHMQRNLDALAKQRGQLERDLENVAWIADAAGEMLDQLSLSRRVLAGEAIESHGPAIAESTGNVEADASPTGRIAALIAIDPARNGLG